MWVIFLCLYFCLVLHSPTEHNKLRYCLDEAVFVLELDLDLSRVLPLTPAQEQAAATPRFLDPCVGAILQLFSLFVPLNLYRFMADKMHFEDGILAHFNRHGLNEITEVFRADSWGILKKKNGGADI